MIRSVLAVLIVAGCTTYDQYRQAGDAMISTPTEAESLWSDWCYQAHRDDALRALKANACRMDGPSRYFRR